MQDQQLLEVVNQRRRMGVENLKEKQDQHVLEVVNQRRRSRIGGNLKEQNQQLLKVVNQGRRRVGENLGKSLKRKQIQHQRKSILVTQIINCQNKKEGL